MNTKDNATHIVGHSHQSGHVWNTEQPVLPYPFVLKPIAAHTFFAPRQPFNPLSFLLNPYILMMGLPLLMMLVMPKLLQSMDPEAVKELEKAQKDMASQSSLLSFMQGGQGASSTDHISQHLASFMVKQEQIQKTSPSSPQSSGHQRRHGKKQR